ncbi:MAG TPA: hypothetical protein VKA92_07245 [Segetibacter sp.]|nr:hypothetical protein [Segetibacter sp.]
MKKCFIIVLMLIYGLSSSGMTINLHYCCGKLDGVSFTGKKEKPCKMGNHIKKSGCCNDKQISASLNFEQQAATKWVQLTKQTIAVPVYLVGNTSFKDYIVSTNRLARGTPDLLPSIPLFVKNRVFRI